MTRNAIAPEQPETPIPVFDPPAKPKINKYALICSLMASLPSILLGYDIGVMSGAITYIDKDVQMTDVERWVMMGITNLISPIGSLIAGRTSDKIGRRYTIIISGFIFFVSAWLMCFATNYPFLISGRIVAGIGVGFGMMIAPVYTAEVAPTSARGFLTTFPGLFINVGILLGYLSNVVFSMLPHNIGWRCMLGIGVFPAVCIVIGSLFIPESPRWLVINGWIGDARRVLDKTTDSPEEANTQLHVIMEAAGIPQLHCNDYVVSVPKQNSVWRDLVFPTPAMRHILMCAFGIYLFHQLCGIDSVVLYSPVIFEMLGVKGEMFTMLVTVGIGFTKTIFILVATFFVDKYGRRPLLLTSMGGMAISLMGLSTSFNAIDNSDHPPVWVVVLSEVCLLSFVAFHSLGMGPVLWVYGSEIFPLKVRATGASFGVALNRGMSGVIAITFVSLYKSIMIGGAFFVYGGVAVVGWVFIYTALPETRGKGLEETEALFGTFFMWNRR